MRAIFFQLSRRTRPASFAAVGSFVADFGVWILTVMTLRQDGFKFGALKRWVASLLLLAFALRALVPAGYMPDFAAAAKGEYKVVICSAAGSKTISLDADGVPVPTGQSEHYDQPCAFTGLLACADPALDALTISAPTDATEVATPRRTAVLPPARAGPALGSRAPPQLS